MIIYSKKDIFDYLKKEKTIRNYIRNCNCNGNIPSKIPNLSSHATESLVCHLIEDGTILYQLKPIISVKRFGSTGKDILVNSYHKIEVKGTTSSTGTVTVSKSNCDAFAWIWTDFRPYFFGKNIIPVHVVTNPKECLKSFTYVKARNEHKITITSMIKQAHTQNNYEYKEFNVKSMRICSNTNNFFY